MTIDDTQTIDDEQRRLDKEYLDACKDGNLPGVQAAISAGARPNARGAHEETGVHLAVPSCNLVLLKYLLDTLKLPVDALDDKDQTPLHWAGTGGNSPAIEVLTAFPHCANPLAEDKSSRKPSDCADAWCHADAANLLRTKEKELTDNLQTSASLAGKFPRKDDHGWQRHLHLVPSGSATGKGGRGS